MNTNTLVQLVTSNVIGNDSSWFWSMAQFWAVTISLLLIWFQLKMQHMGNMLTLLGTFHDRWHSIDLIQARIHICEDFTKAETSIQVYEEPVLNFFEELGLYLKKGVFDKEIVWEIYSYEVQHYWQILRPRVDAFTTVDNDKTWYSNFKYLFDEMNKQSLRKNAKLPETQEALEKFVKGELVRRSPKTNS